MSSPKLKLTTPRITLDSRWGTFIVSAGVGLTVGLVVSLFTFLLQSVEHVIRLLLGSDFEHFMGSPLLSTIHGLPKPVIILLLISIGGIVSGICNRFLPSFRNDTAIDFGTNAVIRSFNGHEKHLSTTSSAVRTLFASPILLGTGGSAGIEGTVAHLGGAIGIFYSRLLPAFSKNRRMFIICGSSAAIGAAFHAPLGASIYMAEVLYFSSDIETGYIAHSVIASVSAYAVSIAFYGHHALFRFKDLAFATMDIPFTILLAVSIIPVSLFFTGTFQKIQEWFAGINIPIWARPIVGALMVGILLAVFPRAGGVGYHYVQELIDGGGAVTYFIAFIICKIIATSLTVGSGGNGGLFGPSIVIGATLGALFAAVMKQLGFDLNTGTYIVLGMAAFLSSTENTPISSIIMITEITGTYELLIPLSLASVTAYFLGRRSILYNAQVESRIESSANYGRYINTEALKKTSIRDILKIKVENLPIVEPSMQLTSIMNYAKNSELIYLFPVIDRENKLHGFIDTFIIREDIAEEVLDPAMGPLIVAEDMMIRDVVTLREDESVYSLLPRLLNGDDKRRGMENFPVLSKEGKFLGILRSIDVMQQQMKLLDQKVV